MIVTVGGIKGGSGKSTVATNLAVIRSQEGHDVLLIDADDQETSSDFTMLRNESIEGGAGFTSIKLTGPAVRTETLRLKEKYEDIIIDTGGRDTTSQRAALSVSDTLLIPFMPRSFDLWTIDKVAELVEEMRMANPNLGAYTFLSKADSRGSDNDDTADLLKSSERLQFIEPSLGLRKAFSNAAAAGLAVTEAKPQDAKAIEEMMTLYRFIFKIESTL
jgi:chromosome partitioning protein